MQYNRIITGLRHWNWWFLFSKFIDMVYYCAPFHRFVFIESLYKIHIDIRIKWDLQCVWHLSFQLHVSWATRAVLNWGLRFRLRFIFFFRQLLLSFLSSHNNIRKESLRGVAVAYGMIRVISDMIRKFWRIERERERLIIWAKGI